MSFSNKSDNKLEELYGKGNWSVRSKAEKELEDRGYEYTGYEWIEKHEEYPGLPLHTELLRRTFKFIFFLSLILMNSSLYMLFLLLFPIALFWVVKTKFIRDILYIIPIFLFNDLWTLVLLVFRFVPPLNKYFSLHMFSAIYSILVLTSNVSRVNEVRIKYEMSFGQLFWDSNWSHMFYSGNSLLWTCIIYLFVFIPYQIFSKRKRQQIISNRTKRSKN